MNKFCQSCGMPIKKDPELGGTNSDGTKSECYCSYCFKGGEFTQPDITAQEMQSFCITQMKKMGMPTVFGWLLTRNIPRLARWAEK